MHVILGFETGYSMEPNYPDVIIGPFLDEDEARTWAVNFLANTYPRVVYHNIYEISSPGKR